LHKQKLQRSAKHAKRARLKTHLILLTQLPDCLIVFQYADQLISAELSFQGHRLDDPLGFHFGGIA
jgi:hypothetical protein